MRGSLLLGGSGRALVWLVWLAMVVATASSWWWSSITGVAASPDGKRERKFKIKTRPYFERAARHEERWNEMLLRQERLVEGGFEADVQSAVKPPTSDTTDTTTTVTAVAQGKNRDVLLIIVDDMRPEVKVAYGRKQAYTPYFDTFARDPNTLVVDYAFAQYPLCSPSRTSFLCGKSPETLMNYKQNQPIQFVAKNVLTLPQWFARQGYKTYLGGKVFHQQGEDILFNVNILPKFSRYLGSKSCLRDKFSKPISRGRKDKLAPRLGCTTGTWVKNLADFRLAFLASSTLMKIAKVRQRKAADPKGSTPDPNFFMAVGFIKPHLPYYVHKTFWKMINSSSIDDVENWALGGPQPQDKYSVFLTADGSNPFYKRGFNSNPWAGDNGLPDVNMRELLKAAYIAAVAQSDNAVSILMNALESSGLAANTLVIITADHGFALGENRLWGKETLFDVATRVPFMIRVPWLNSPDVHRVKRAGATLFVELLDMYRTIAGFLDLTSTLNKDIEGQDKSQAIANLILAGGANASGGGSSNVVVSGGGGNSSSSDSNATSPGQQSAGDDDDRRQLLVAHERTLDSSPDFARRAYSIVTRCQGPKCPNDQSLDTIVRLGYTVRTPMWRYTVFFPANKGVLSLPSPPSRDQALQEELYVANDESDLLNYAQGASFATNHLNVADAHPDVCDSLFVVLGARFGW